MTAPMDVPTNIFVLCTGRCGSTTLALACGHFTNFTASHESRTHLTGRERLAFPARHIEIDNRMAWFLGRLDATWGDGAAYVHLTRDPEAVAESFSQRAGQGILKAYRQEILMGAPKRSPKTPLIDYCRDYVDTVTRNIALFLKDKTHVMTMRLETLEADFDRLAEWIGAEGDLAAARAQLAVRHNAGGTAAG